jgi:hypothetical protein
MVIAMTVLIVLGLVIIATMVTGQVQELVEPGRTAAPCGGTDDPRDWVIALNPTPPTLQVVR